MVGGDPAPGEPEAFEGLARAWSATADDAGDAHATLRRLAEAVDDSVWRGEAAEAFREKIGELPPRLAKLHESYSTASQAAGVYAGVLRGLQAQAPGLAGQAQQARADEEAAQRSRDRAVAQDPAASTVAYDEAIATARVRLRAAQTGVGRVREEREAAERALVGRLGEAGAQGIQNDRWGGLIGFLKDVGEALEALAVVITIVAIIVVLVVLLTNPAGWAALAAAFAAAGPLFTAAGVLGGIAVGTKAARWTLGDSTVSGKGLLLDIGLMATGGVGRALGKLGQVSRAAGKLDDVADAARAIPPPREGMPVFRVWGQAQDARGLPGDGGRPGSGEEGGATVGSVLDTRRSAPHPELPLGGGAARREPCPFHFRGCAAQT